MCFFTFHNVFTYFIVYLCVRLRVTGIALKAVDGFLAFNCPEQDYLFVLDLRILIIRAISKYIHLRRLLVGCQCWPPIDCGLVAPYKCLQYYYYYVDG